MGLIKKILAIFLSIAMIISYNCIYNNSELIKDTYAAEKFKLNKTKVTMRVGQKVKLTVFGSGKKKIYWKSLNKKVVSVNKNGTIKALKKGKSTIIASVLKKKLKCKVIVKEKRIGINKTNVILYTGQTITLKTVGIKTKVEWAIKGKKIVKLSKKKKNSVVVKTIKTGKTVITATVKKKIASKKKGKKAKSKTKKIVYKCKIFVINKQKDTSNSTNQNAATTNDNSNGSVSNNDSSKPSATSGKADKSGNLIDNNSSTNSSNNSENSKDGDQNDNDDSDEQYITREEWVSKLVKLLKLSSEQTYYDYDDSIDAENPDDIQAAIANNILDVDEDEVDHTKYFYPTETASKEFIAYTAARATGEVTDADKTVTVDCEDSDDLSKVKDDKIALDDGFVELEDGCFNPYRYMTEDEAEDVFTKLTSYLEKDKKEKNKCEINYQEDINKFNVNYDLTEDYVQIKDKNYENKFDVDGIYVLTEPDDSDAVAWIKVTKVETDIDGIKVYYSNPSLNELFNDVDVSYENDSPSDSIFIPSDNVQNVNNSSVEVKSKNRSKSRKNDGFNDTKKAISRKWKDLLHLYHKFDTRFDASVPINCDKSLSLESKLEIPDADGKSTPYTLKMKNKIDINSVYCRLKGRYNVIPKLVHLPSDFSVSQSEVNIGIKNTTDFTLGYEKDNSDSGDDLKENNASKSDKRFKLDSKYEKAYIGSLMIDVVGPVFLSIAFYAVWDVSGEVTLEFVNEGTFGVNFNSNRENKFRRINTVKTTESSLIIDGDGKTGIRPEATLMLTILPVFGVYADLGPGINASGKFNMDNNQFCIDAQVYLWIDIGAFLFTDQFEIPNSNITLFDADTENNPLKKNVHIEETGIVPKCTREKGTYKGKVVYSSILSPVCNARVELINSKGMIIEKEYTDWHGIYRGDEIPTGNYKLRVTALGDRSREINVKIESGSNKIETINLINAYDDETHKISGYIDDVSDENLCLANAKIDIYYQDNPSSKIASVDADDIGYFDFDLVANNYIFRVSCDDYYTGEYIVPVSDSDISRNFDLVKYLDDDTDIKVILTWGENPVDIDSHLRNDEDSDFHIFYNNKEESGCNLDRDDTDSYGPETVTITSSADDAVYSYYVHDYTNKDSIDSDSLSDDSSAMVMVYNKNGLLAEYEIPFDKEGTVWHVFDYDKSTGSITKVNSFDYQDDVYSVGEE